MDAFQESSCSSDIRELIIANDVSEVEKILKVNPVVLSSNVDLINLAKTSQMVETLLLLGNSNDEGVERAVSNPEGFDSFSLEEGSVPSAIRSDISLQTIGKVFPKLLERWPLTVLKILDKQIEYKGLSQGDPDFSVEVDYSLFRSQMDINSCCSLWKINMLIHLSQLDVTEAESKQILLHPVLLTYLHAYSKSDWKKTLLKFLLLITGWLLIMTENIVDLLYEACWEVEGSTHYPNFQEFLSTIRIINSPLFVFLFLLHTLLELPKLMVVQNHWKEILFQLLFFIGVPFCIFNAIPRTESTTIYTTILTLLLLLNLLEQLSKNTLCGKFILLSFSVLKTISKNILPILLLILALATTEFTIRYGEIVAAYLNRNPTEDWVVYSCQTLTPTQGAYGALERRYFAKSILQVLSIMYGYIDTSHLTQNYTALRQADAELEPSHTVHWLLTTMLTTLILMNLLIGLTIGDLGSIERNADCLMVQIELKKLYRRLLRRDLCCCFCKCFGVVCRKKRMKKRTLIFYPNRPKGRCVMEKRKTSRRLHAFFVPDDFILGARKIRRALLDHYSKKYF